MQIRDFGRVIRILGRLRGKEWVDLKSHNFNSIKSPKHTIMNYKIHTHKKAMCLGLRSSVTALFITAALTFVTASSLLFPALLVAQSDLLVAQDDTGKFITTWKTTTANETIKIEAPFVSSPSYDFTIEWGDGSPSENLTGNDFIFSHTYSNPGTYTVKISGTFPGMDLVDDSFNSDDPIDNHTLKILSVEQWGDIVWYNVSFMFEDAENLTINATDAPDLSQVTSLAGMFSGARNMNGDLSNWDVSNVTNMERMFQRAYSFNGDISGWDVSNVTDMYSMFYSAYSFDQNLGNWDVSKVSDFDRFFSGLMSVENYNATLSGWSQLTLQSGITIDFGLSMYSDAGEAARQSIINAGVTINDTGLFPYNTQTGTDLTVGSGTEGDPYIITTPQELDAVRKYPDAHFKLGNDIDMDSFGNFEPIPSLTGKFTGSFDGDNHTISNLSSKLENESAGFTSVDVFGVGLFSVVDTSSVVKNLTLESVDITSNSYDTGGIIGKLYGSLTNSTVSGKVTATDGDKGGAVGEMEDGSTVTNVHADVLVDSKSSDTGGLVGYNDKGTIENSSATGDVYATQSDAGGLVGENNGGTIILSFATGDVTSSSSNVGGLVGFHDKTDRYNYDTDTWVDVFPTISKSYATGNVGLTGKTNNGTFVTDNTVEDVGGLVGENDEGIISNTYALGNVYGTDDTGGLVGYEDGGTVESSYSIGRVVNVGDIFIGGLIADRTSASTISKSYWIDYYTGDSAIAASERNSHDDSIKEASAIDRPFADYTVAELQGSTAETTAGMGGNSDGFFDFGTVWQVAPDDMPGAFPTLQGITAPSGAPLPPTGVKATGQDGQVELTWLPNAETDIAKYTVYSSPDSINFVRSTENKITEITHTGSALTYTHSELENDSTYFYQITATDTDGNESRNAHHAVAGHQNIRLG